VTATATGDIRAYREPCSSFTWDPRDPGYDNHIIRYNNLGFHDELITVEKPNGTTRILILGDSYPQGLQVPREQGFPDLIETRLNAERTGRYEVLNFGIDTIGTDRMLMLYALTGYRFDADLVLLVTYVGNDIQNNSIELAALRNEGYSPRPFFKLDSGGNLRLYNWTGTFPDDNAPAPNWLRRAVLSRDYPIVTPAAPAVLNTDPYTLEYPVQLGLYLPEDDTWAEAWAISGAILAQFAEIVPAQGSDLGVVVIPDRRAVHPADYAATQRDFPFVGDYNALAPVTRTVAQAEAAGIPTLNTLPGLQAVEAAGGRAYLPLDGHLTPEGHQVIADALYGWLTTTYDLP
jgi:lysophospholipase L1-like esterase